LNRGATERDIVSRGRCFIVPYGVRVPIAELAIATSPPTANSAVVEESARVKPSCRELNSGAAEVDIASGGGRFVVSYGVCISVSESATKAPTTNSAVAEERAGVYIPRSKLNRGATKRDIASGGRCFIVPYGVCISIAECASATKAPTANRAITEESARMTPPRRELNRGASEVDITGGGGRFVVSYGVCISVSESATATKAPTTNSAITEESARMTPPRRELNDRKGAVRVAGISINVVAIVALFGSGENKAIPTAGELANVGAAIRITVVAVVALFSGAFESIAAHNGFARGRKAEPEFAPRLSAGDPVVFRFVAYARRWVAGVDGAGIVVVGIESLELATIGDTGIRGAGVVIAAIAGRLTGEGAIALATVVVGVVAVVALLAEAENAIPASRK
jgi:hypothetical protein